MVLEVEDDQLQRKQDMDAFDAWNDMQYYYLSNKKQYHSRQGYYWKIKNARDEQTIFIIIEVIISNKQMEWVKWNDIINA